MKKFRSRKFCIMLYPNEDDSHKKALEYLKNNYDIAYINHDKDKTETGEIKKQHTHVVVSLENAKWNTSLSNEIGLEINYIQKCRSFENALDYLIHYNDNTKYQYSLDEVQGTLKNKLKKKVLSDGKSEDDKSLELIEFIENTEGYIKVSEFAKYCSIIGMWDVLRRSSGLFLSIIKEHNINYVRRYKDASSSTKSPVRGEETQLQYELTDDEIIQFIRS